MAASERALGFTKNFTNAVKASYQKEFVLFSFYCDLLTANPGKLLSNSTNLLSADPDLAGNKLVQVWNIVRQFYLSYFRRVVNPTLNRTFLGVRYKKLIS